jgi:hypothetical protein
VFYDNWVARDINGTALENAPFEQIFHHTESEKRFMHHLPVQGESRRAVLSLSLRFERSNVDNEADIDNALLSCDMFRMLYSSIMLERDRRLGPSAFL